MVPEQSPARLRKPNQALRRPPTPISLASIECENNEPIPVSGFSPDNQEGLDKEVQIVRPNCFLQGVRNLIWRCSVLQERAHSVDLSLWVQELLLAFLAGGHIGPTSYNGLITGATDHVGGTMSPGTGWCHQCPRTGK